MARDIDKHGMASNVDEDFHLNIQDSMYECKCCPLHFCMDCLYLKREVKVDYKTPDTLSTHQRRKNAYILWIGVSQKIGQLQDYTMSTVARNTGPVCDMCAAHRILLVCCHFGVGKEHVSF